MMMMATTPPMMPAEVFGKFSAKGVTVDGGCPLSIVSLGHPSWTVGDSTQRYQSTIRCIPVTVINSWLPIFFTMSIYERGCRDGRSAKKFKQGMV